MDEATSNPDARSAAEVRHAPEDAMKDRTTVIVSHNMKEIRNAEYIIVLNHGRAEAAGTHEELF